MFLANNRAKQLLVASARSFILVGDYFINPINLVCLLILIMPFTLGTLVPGLLSYTFEINYFIDLLIILLIYPQILKHKRILPIKYTVLIVLFSLSFFISLLFGPEYVDMTKFTIYNSSFLGVLKDILLFIPLQLLTIFLIYLTINSIDTIKKYIKMFLLSSLLVYFVTTLLLINGSNFVGTAGSRVGGPFDDANYLGRFALMIAIICITLLVFKNFLHIKKSILILLTSISLIFIILSLSRSALLVFGFMVIFIGLLARKKILFIFLIVLSVGLVFFLLQYQASQRLVNIGGDLNILTSILDLSNSTRLGLDVASVNMFIDNPISGVGYHNFYNIYINQNYVPASIPVIIYVSVVHSWLFAVLSEQGLLGTIPLLLIIFFIFKDFSKILRNSEDLVFKTIGYVLLNLFVILIVNGLLFPVFFTEMFFSVLMGMIGGYYKLGRLNIL